VDARDREEFGPVTVTRCGERFRLAGFGFADPRRGVTNISVRFAGGAAATFYPGDPPAGGRASRGVRSENPFCKLRG
jgi:hypothetical protein